MREWMIVVVCVCYHIFGDNCLVLFIREQSKFEQNLGRKILNMFCDTPTHLVHFCS